MTINELFNTNNERCQRWHSTPESNWSVLEWAGAMCGEAGEAANAAKKLKRILVSMKNIDERAIPMTTVLEAQNFVAKECADTILYALLLMANVGVENPESVIADVFNHKSEEYGFPERL